MPGKSGKSKGKKKKGAKGDGTHIAAALMPVASFAAVPRTPPPTRTPPPEVGFGISSGVLNTTLLGRMFASPEPGDDHVLSDTDTSLFDYQHTQELGGAGAYAEVEFRRASRASDDGRRFTYSDRDRAPTPTDEMLSEGEIEGAGPLYHVFDRNAEVEASAPSVPTVDNVYAVSTKMRPKATKGSRRSGAHYGDGEPIDEAVSQQSLKEPYSPSPHQSLRRSTEQQQIEERIEKQIAASHNMSGSLPSYTLASQLAPQHLEPSPSSTLNRTPKLLSLKTQNEELLRKQASMEHKLQEQQEQQQEIMRRLQEMAASKPADPVEEQQAMSTMDSLLNETQTITDQTLNQQSELIKSVQQRSLVLEQEKKEIEQINEQLQLEIHSLKQFITDRENVSEASGSGGPVLKKQLKDYKEENSTLKNTIHRLNVELSQYQAKYRPPVVEKDDMVGLPTKGPIPSWLINTKYLSPLFLSYDDRLTEKDKVIRQCQTELDGFRQQIEQVIKENQRLHLRIEQSDISGPISMTEWRQLQEQAKLVLEENQLLMEQLEVHQNKTRDLQKTHIAEATKLKKEMTTLEISNTETERRLEETLQQYSQVQEETRTIISESTSKVTIKDHVQALTDLKKKLDDESNQHMQEMEAIKTILQTVQSEKTGFGAQVDQLSSENKQLQEEIGALQREERKSQKKIILLQTALNEAETKELSAQHYLSSMVKMAEKTALERDNLSKVVHDSEQKKDQVFNKLMKGNLAVGRMEEKLKSYKLKVSQKLEQASHRLKEQDLSFNQLKHEYEREIKHLRVMLQEREDMMQMLAGEKKNMEDDLEVMWQAATEDNRQMQTTLRKSLHNSHLQNSSKDLSDTKNLIVCTSDTEA